MHVLTVDDEPLAQIALTNILAGRREVEGFDTANDAVEALDKLMHRSFDVLLLDISMPEVSGIELLDQLTAHGRLLCPFMLAATMCRCKPVPAPTSCAPRFLPSPRS